MTINVLNGTTTDRHLCLTCIQGTTRLTAHGKEETFCCQFHRASREMIIKCNSFEAKRDPAPVWMLRKAKFLWISRKGKAYWLTEDEYEDADFKYNTNREEREDEKASK